MKFLKQSDINKMPIVSFQDLETRKNSIKNYVVYLGNKTYSYPMEVHIGLASENHLETIKELLQKEGQPIFKVLENNKKMKSFGIGLKNSKRDY